MDEWAERRCHLLDGCRWQSLLFMRSADRERFDNSCPGSGGNGSCRPRRCGADVGGQLKERATVTSNVQPVIRGSLRDGAGHPVAGGNSLHLRDGRPPRCITRADQLGNDAGERALCNQTRRLGPSRQLDLVYRYNDRVLDGQVKLDSTGRTNSSRLRGRASQTAMRRASGGVYQAPMPTGGRWQCRPGWAASGAPSSSCGPRLMAGSVGKYRFTQTTGRVRYVFRALVKRQSGYPYEPGASPKRKLVVHG